MMCDWDREFGEEAKEKQRKLGEELTVDMIKKKSCGVCKYANPSTVGYYMTDLFCLKYEEYLNFKYERPCSCFILDDYYLEKYGSTALSKEEG